MKLQSVIRWMVLAAVVLVAAHAFAAPVNLLCDATVRITFDEDHGTAFINDAPASRASFTATNIKWSTPANDGTPIDYNLDRISGILSGTSIWHNARQTSTWTCVVAEKKF